MDAKTRRPGVIKRSRVRLDEPARGPQPSMASPDGAPAQAEGVHAGAPRVRLVRLDESTQALELVCSCGEVSLVEIHCEKKP